MKRKSASRPLPGPSQRQLRVGEEIRHALVEILATHSLLDPELAEKSVTVTQVKMTPDLKLATIFILPFGAKEDSAQCAAALNRASGYFRGRLARMVRMKFAPRLHFLVDGSFDHAGRIEALLRSPELEKDLRGDETQERE